ncbi:LuxR C-terminal-related transcriptional regulator [Rubellimicrobium arenae]|uniref:LuxR C-terminal-related transcriptional regulator n=1 Tax=Rubellimicrobium arenae TaxID=2817372 RepID=UPI001B302BB6
MRLSAALTKPPRSMLQKVGRPVLTTQLIQGLERQFVLIRAPAGYAKTETMTAAYRVLLERGARCIWLSLAPGLTTTDTVRFLAFSLGLGETTDPDVVIEAIAAAQDGPVHLFLDSAEHLSSQPQVLGWLLDDPPDLLRLAIAGRSLPQMRLSRLRSRGLVTEFNLRDLAFGRGEVQQLLGQRLAPAELEKIGDTLAGWPVLVSLSAMVLEGGAAPADRAEVVHGTHPVLREFVMEEVVPSLNQVELAVLKGCQDIQSFTLDIAADLAGLPHEHGTLRQMEALPPLILAEGQHAGWFRLHPVIAQALPLLGSESAAARRTRHIRAAALFAERRLLEKSVLHASLAGDYDLAVRTIEQAGGVNLFLRAGYTTLQGIVKAVPHDVVLATPSLRLCRGVMLAKSGQVREARSVIDTLISDTESGAIPSSASWAAALEHISSLNDIYEDRALDDAGIARLEQAAGQERQENTWRLGWLFNHLAIAHTRRGDLEAAQVAALKALACYQEERSSYPQVFMLIHLGFVNLRANRLDPALTYCRQAESMIRSHHWNDPNLLAIAQVPLAVIRYLQGDTAQAGQMLERAMPAMARGEGWVDFFVQGYATLARARLATAGWSPAQEVLQDGLAVADSRGLTRLRLSLSILRVELLTRTGQLEAAETITRQLPDPAEWTAWPTPREQREAMLALGRLLLRNGDVARAADILDSLAEECRSSRREGLLLRVDLLRCEVHWLRAEVDAALGALEEAAQLSIPGQQSRQFQDEGAPLADAVRALVRRTGLSRLSRTAADYLARTAGPSTRNNRQDGILSHREREILALLAEGLTNKGMARRLGISEPTVKFHLKNLYAKLGVSRRALALRVAKASGLL